MADNDYWKKKCADYHSRSESRIAELKAENERLKEEIEKLGKKHEDYCNIMY